MTTNWKGGNGDWQTAANWTNGAPTTPSAFAVINAAGTYTVRIGSGLEYHVGAVSLNAAGAKLAIAGILDLTNKLTVSKGRLALAGTINGGTIIAAGGAVRFQTATLDGVTYDGTLDLKTTTAVVTVKDGLTLRNAAGNGGGILKIGGKSQLIFDDAQTLNNGTLEISGGTISGDSLTFGASEKVLYSDIRKSSVFKVPTALDNHGSFTVGERANFAAIKFTNRAGATIQLMAGSTFTVKHSFSSTTTPGFYNQGKLVADHAKLTLYQSGGELGTLKATNSIIILGTFSDTAALDAAAAMLAGGNNRLTAQVLTDNTGNTLDLTAQSGFAKFAYSVNITGGTVSIDAPFAGQLTDVAYRGAADVVGALTLRDVSFSGADGTGSATMNLSGKLYVQGGIDNVTVVATAHSFIDMSSSIGADATIKALGTFRLGDPRAIITNNGTIEADGGAKSLFAVQGGVTNYGTIRVENGSKLVIHFTYANYDPGTGTLKTGTYEIGANSEINGGSVDIVTLQANVSLEGPGTRFMQPYLATIGAQGTLSLENDATLSIAPHFTVEGALSLSGSNLTATSFNVDGDISLANGKLTASRITLNAEAKVSGYGALLSAIVNSGSIEALGGTLSIGQSVTGTGQDAIGNGATLQFGSDVSAGQTVTFAGATGTLALGNARDFAGTIAGFAQGDTIDLINTKAGSVVYHAVNDTLSVKFQGKIIATLQLSGDYTGDTFGIASDGNGGTAITLTGVVPGALQRFTEARASFSSSDMMAAANPTATIAGWDSSHMLAAAGHA